MQAIPMPNWSALKKWFEIEARALPWRGSPTPYEVWVSEVMLQQTQAAVVIPYFERWMQRFPTVEALANAPIEEVIKIWEGLGYYARARNLHAGAQAVVHRFQGQLPSSNDDLATIKGLGPYTVGAIRSFAFHQKAVAVDGNVSRVLSRLLLIQEEVDQPSIQKKIRAQLEELLPDEQPWIIMEALIELGARICTKRPHCLDCPLRKDCAAYQQGRQEELPKKKKRPQTLNLQRKVAVIIYNQELLLRVEREKRVMQGLYEFPYAEEGKDLFHEQDPLKYAKWISELSFYKELPLVEHGFTRFRVRLHPSIWKTAEKCFPVGYEWVEWKRLAELPFSSGHRKILSHLHNNEEIHAPITY